jgi:hypothetical protein
MGLGGGVRRLYSDEGNLDRKSLEAIDGNYLK